MTSPVERGSAALIAELKRQGEASGCTAETDGRFAQVDGSFEIEPLVRAVLKAALTPTRRA